MSDYWYRDPGPASDIVIATRVRLLRNFEGYNFPNRMSPEEKDSLLQRVEKTMGKVEDVLSEKIPEIPLENMSTSEKMALHERQIMNHASLVSGEPFGLFASANEDFSVTVNGTDHLRILASGRGERFGLLSEKVRKAENTIGEAVPYAYHERFGYLTSQVQNLGTGMRAYAVVHLPLLSAGRGFKKLIQDMSRCGIQIREAWTKDAHGAGGLFVLYNQRTLGLTGEEILSFVNGVTDRIADNERALRRSIPEIRLRDMVMRSYGILKYATMLDLTEACTHLSNLLLGESLGYIRCTGGVTLYELLLGVFPGNLQVFMNTTCSDAEMKEKRSAYIRAFMPGIVPAE